LGGLLHDEVKDGWGDLGNFAREEAVERLNEIGRKDEILAGELILKVLRHGGGGHEDAHVRVGVAQRRPQDIEYVCRFSRTCGARYEAHCPQCSAGRIKVEERDGA